MLAGSLISQDQFSGLYINRKQTIKSFWLSLTLLLTLKHVGHPVRAHTIQPEHITYVTAD
ncbi:MAG: hypothetical protein R3C11_12245 [Planctomycetaceae bacterium]